jgi:hypothetical protein
MGALMSGFCVKEHPINYYKRVGKSSMHPIKDTYRFFRTALRLGLLFFPMKVFGPIAVILLALGAAKGVIRDFLVIGYIGNLAVILMVGGIQILMLGLIGEMIVHSRSLKFRKPPSGISEKAKTVGDFRNLAIDFPADTEKSKGVSDFK